MDYKKGELTILKQSKGLEPIIVLAVTPDKTLIIGTLCRGRGNQLYLNLEDVMYRNPDTAATRAGAVEVFDEHEAQMKRLVAP